MITESHFLLSIAIELCWRPPSIHSTPASTIEKGTQPRFSFQELLKSAVLSSFQWGLLCVFKETYTFAL